jgi:hypothetical protein
VAAELGIRIKPVIHGKYHVMRRLRPYLEGTLD